MLRQCQIIYFALQKNAGAVNIHRLGKNDAAVNRLCAGLTFLGLGCVLYTFASMSLGINKKKRSEE